MSENENFVPLALALAAANKTIEELRAKLASREEPWQPIKTAPETGEDILCGIRGGNRLALFPYPRKRRANSLVRARLPDALAQIGAAEVRNKYRGGCADGCGKIVEPGGGIFQKRRGGQRATAARLIAAAREKAHPRLEGAA